MVHFHTSNWQQVKIQPTGSIDYGLLTSGWLYIRAVTASVIHQYWMPKVMSRLHIPVQSVYICLHIIDIYHLTKIRLSSHTFLVERGRWVKPKINYHERLCTLCDENDIEDEYHILMKCNYCVNLREKYTSKKYYNRPSFKS